MKALDVVQLLTKEQLESLDHDTVIELALEHNRKLLVLLEAVESMDAEGARAERFLEHPAPEDQAVRDLCSRYGYGAVMDSLARQWFLKDHISALVVGPCAGLIRHAFKYIKGEVEAPSRLQRDWGIK